MANGEQGSDSAALSPLPSDLEGELQGRLQNRRLAPGNLGAQGPYRGDRHRMLLARIVRGLRRGHAGTSRLGFATADAPRRARGVGPSRLRKERQRRTSAYGCQAAVLRRVAPLVGYLAPTNRFWSSASVSIWTRRGLTLSLRGSVNRSIPCRWEAVSFSRSRNCGMTSVCS